jgi:hypothetical protein
MITSPSGQCRYTELAFKFLIAIIFNTRAKFSHRAETFIQHSGELAIIARFIQASAQSLRLK